VLMSRTDTRWYLYVAKCSDGSFYTGITTDVARRLDEHNTASSGAKYTRSRRPVELIFQEEYSSQSEALKAEFSFKKLTRRQKLRIISPASID
jgi:putative endonuclease